jgi:uncharacterized protein YdbL (DUF1318 family)
MLHAYKRVIWIMVLLLASLPAWALSLEQAKTQGLIGEQLNGYVGIVTASPSAELHSLVTDINQQRRALYQQSAQEASVTLEVFEIRAGQRLQGRAKTGEYLQDQNGQWRRK